MYIFKNPNPGGSYVGDCVVRAISLLTGTKWETTYMELCIQGLINYDMPSSNRVWHEYLKLLGYKPHPIISMCPGCYTVRDFCGEHFKGRYLLGTGTHAVCVIDGDYLDTWDSGDEVPIIYWSKED